MLCNAPDPILSSGELSGNNQAGKFHDTELYTPLNAKLNAEKLFTGGSWYRRMSPAAKHRKHRGQGNEAPGLKAPILHISDAKALEVVFFLLHFPTTDSCLGYKVNSAEWKDALLPKALQYHIKLPRDVQVPQLLTGGLGFMVPCFSRRNEACVVPACTS